MKKTKTEMIEFYEGMIATAKLNKEGAKNRQPYNFMIYTYYNEISKLKENDKKNPNLYFQQTL